MKIDFDWTMNGFGLGIWFMKVSDRASILSVQIGPFMLFFGLIHNAA